MTANQTAGDNNLLQDYCSEIQLKLGLSDIEWKKKFSDEHGLYGLVNQTLSGQLHELKQQTPEKGAKLSWSSKSTPQDAYNAGYVAGWNEVIDQVTALFDSALQKLGDV